MTGDDEREAGKRGDRGSDREDVDGDGDTGHCRLDLLIAVDLGLSALNTWSAFVDDCVPGQLVSRSWRRSASCSSSDLKALSISRTDCAIVATLLATI